MDIFYMLIVFIFPLSIMANLYKDKNNEANKLFTIIVIIILVLISGLRSNMGDTSAYKHLYNMVASNTYEYTKGGYEIGFVYFIYVLTRISANPQFMIFITSLITNVLNVWTFRKYSSYFELQTFMYIAAGYYIASMNGIRQALVASILFAATPYIIKGNFKRYLIIVLLASTMHTSAFIMIPVYFIVRNKMWSKKIAILILSSIVGVILIEPLLEIVFNLIEGSKYSIYENVLDSELNAGVNIIRILVAFVPVGFSYIMRERLKSQFKESNIFVNMSLLNFIVMLFASYSWLFARFNYYFQVYNFILLPYCIKLLINKKEKNLIFYLCIVCYIIYFWYDTRIMGINYMSNYIG